MISGGTVCAIMVGGPTKGTRFRPLSLYLAKPLFPIAGLPMVIHPILACKQLPDLKRIYLIGFYEESELLVLDLRKLSADVGVPVEYLQESQAHGSAGGLLSFRDELTDGNPDTILVLNCDVCSNFPLRELISFHESHNGVATLMATKIHDEFAHKDHGVIVAHPETKQLTHYVEKPETAVSDMVNTGIYAFSSPGIFDVVDEIVSKTKESTTRAPARHRPLRSESPASPGCFPFLRNRNSTHDDDHLDFQIGMPKVWQVLEGNSSIHKRAYVYEQSEGFWEVLKTPGMCLKFSALYLSNMDARGKLTSNSGSNLSHKHSIIGEVYIDKSAIIDPAAVIGPNVSVGPRARIGSGARIRDTIILDDVVVEDHSYISAAIVGWNSHVGKWARIQGKGDYMDKLGVTILAEDSTIGDEVVVSCCIVLPHKRLSQSVQNDIIL